LIGGNQFLDDSVYWVWDFNRNNNLLLDWFSLENFNLIVNDLLDRNVTRNFLNHLDNTFLQNIVLHNLILADGEFDKFVNNFFDDLRNFDVYVLLNNDLLNSVLENWHLNYSLNFFNAFLDHDLGNNTFNDLRHLDYLLHNSGNYDYLLNNFFNLNYLWHFHHLFDDLLDWHLNFSDAVDVSDHFNDLFLDVFDGFWHFDVMIDNLFNLDGFWFSYDDGIAKFNNDWNLPFDGLDDGFFDDFGHLNKAFVNDWHFNEALNFLGNLSDHLN
jgi:hypothetical protein